MISQDQEREVKFCILDRGALMGRIVDLGARLEHERTHELNLRFDTRFGNLRRKTTAALEEKLLGISYL